jgi:RimJ/RimL family protein N-acetyltransferase
LRPPRRDDAGQRLQLGRDPEIYRMFGADVTRLQPYTMESAVAWIDDLIRHPAAWVIVEGERLIGEIRIDNPVEADRRAGVAIGILDPARIGRGLGTEALSAIAAFAFDELKLHRLSMRVLAFNTRAIASYRKVGFVEEGRERQSARIGDRYEDDVIMGLLAHEVRRLEHLAEAAPSAP